MIAEWSADDDYAARIDRLMTSAAATLTVDTITDDGESDLLIGDSDDDWFWQGAGDRLFGDFGREQRSDLPPA